MFKSPKTISDANSPSSTVVERNEDFIRNKMKKQQQKELQKLLEHRYEPTLVSK